MKIYVDSVIGIVESVRMKEITRLTLPLPSALHALLLKRAKSARRTLTAEILLTLETITLAKAQPITR